MQIAIDVGNTNIVIAIYNATEIKTKWRLTTRNYNSAEGFGIAFMKLLEVFTGETAYGIVNKKIFSSVSIGSVVPKTTQFISECTIGILKIKPFIADTSMKCGLKICVENPMSLGIDRLLDGVAAFQKYKSAVIIADFGSANTYDYINLSGEFLGGMITPGIKMSSDALKFATAGLPIVDVTETDFFLPKKTEDCINVGVYYSAIATAEFFVNKLKNLYSAECPKVIATGGLSATIQKHSNVFDYVNENLTTDGLILLNNLNK